VPDAPPRRRPHRPSRAIWHGSRRRRPHADAAAASTTAPPAAVPPHSSPQPLSGGGRPPPPLGAGKGAGSITAASPAAAAAAVAPAIAATATGGGCDGGRGGGELWSTAPPSPLPPLAGVRTAADAPAGDGGAEFDGGLPAAAAPPPNCRGRGDRDGCDGRSAGVCTSGGAGVFVCLWLGGGGTAVTAAAAVLVGCGLFSEDVRPLEGGGSRGLQLRSGPKTVVKSTSAFACFGTNRLSAKRPGALSRLVFSIKGAKIICSPG